MKSISLVLLFMIGHIHAFSQCRVDSAYDYYKLGNQPEKPNQMQYLYYNGKDSVVMAISRFWINNKWENIEKTTRTYNQDGRIIRDSVMSYKKGQWTTVGISSNTYDVAGNKLTVETSNRYSHLNGLRNTTKYAYLNYKNGTADSILGYLWDTINQQWQLFTKNITTRDGNNRVKGNVLSKLDAVVSQWEPVGRRHVDYNNNGQVISQSYEYWDAGTAQYIPISLDSTTYNGLGKIETVWSKSWYADQMKFVNYSFVRYTYYKDGKDSSKLTQSWDITGWRNSSETVYVKYIGKTPVKIINYGNWNGNSFEDASTIIMYCQGHSSSIENSLSGTLVFYPQPANDYLIIRYEEGIPSHIELHDANGRWIEPQLLDGNTDMVVLGTKNLAEGIYYLRFLIGDKVVSRSISVMH